LKQNFLLDAVNSVLNQTLPRNEYEILVVKNFSDFDQYLESNGIYTYYTDAKATGEKVALGIDKSHGEILCFLDDDDMFLSNKLETVKMEFNADIAFYNNSKIFIDEQGKEIGRENKHRIEYSDKNIRTAKKFLSNMSFNLSSECIKRDIVDTDKLRYIGYSIDVVMAYFGLNSRGRLKIDEKPLTLLRLHSGNYFVYNRKYTLSEFIEKNRKDYEFGSKISERIKTNFKNTFVGKLAFLEYIADSFYFTIYDSTSLNNRLKALLLAIKYMNSAKDITSIKLVGASLLFLINPNLLYKKLYERYMKKVS